MESDSTTRRLGALDGLRGIAILLVLFSHFNLSIVLENKGSNIFLQMLLDSGEIGVGILFILSGFLMVYLYQNPKSKINFLQKRYTRIFPAFIIVCLVLSIVIKDNVLDINFSKNIYETLLLLLGISLIVHVVWVFLIKKLNEKVKKLMFFLFLLLQISVGLYYFFFVLQQPFFQYLNQESLEKRVWITGLVNATLTLPLGTYVRPLSSVFWSLALEVYFYILYPIICVPIIALLASQIRKVKIIFLLTSLPLFIGTYLVANKLLFFRLLHIELAYFFVGGMILGYIYRKRSLEIENSFLGNTFFSKFSILYLFLVLFVSHFLLNLTSVEIKPLVKLLLAIPFTLLVLMSLNSKTLFSRILRSKILTFIGTISYSLYLIHLLLFDLLKKQLGDLRDPQGIFYFACVYIFVSIGVSGILYLLVERPYFSAKPKNEFLAETLPKEKTKFISFITNSKNVLIFFCLSIIAVVFIAYNSRFSFFSTQSISRREVLVSPLIEKEKRLVYLKDNPKILMNFKAKDNNLSVIELDLDESVNTDIEFKKQVLTVYLKEVGTQKIYESSYSLINYEDPLPSLFGFLPIADSKGKLYEAELTLDNTDSSKDLSLLIDDFVLKSHYSVNKNDLLKNPLSLGYFLINKIESVFNNREARIVLLLFSPFILMSFYIFLRDRRDNTPPD